MDPIKTLKALIKNEIGFDRPSFSLVKTYTEALREALARRHLVSVDDLGERSKGHFDEDGEENPYTVTTRGSIMLGMSKKRSEPMEDQLLTAMDQMRASTGPDPLAALLQALPAVESLYAEHEREPLRQRLRALVDRRLGMTPADAQVPTLAALTARSTST